MSAELLEPLPHDDIGAIRARFAEYGHVGIRGLLDASLLGPALGEAERLCLRPRERVLGEQVSTLRRAPDAADQPSLHQLLLDVEGAVAELGRDITPSSRREKPLIQVIRMVRAVRGPLHQDSDALSDVVAIANLKGRSGLWFESAAMGGSKPVGPGAQYTVEEGELVIHDLRRNLWHRGFTGSGGERAGLAIAKHGGQ